MRTTLLLIVLSSVCRSATLSLPPSTTLQGQAGGSVGWGYLMSVSHGYGVPTFSEFSSPSDDGLYLDFVSLPKNFVLVLPIGSSGQFFNQAQQTGVGEFFID